MRQTALFILASVLAFVFQAAYGPSFRLSPPPAFADPTPSGAQPTTVPNGDFSGEGLGQVGTPPTNHDFETAGGSVGTPPSNYDFETGDFTGWTLTGSPSVQSGGPTGYYAQVGSGQRVLSSAFTVDSSAQSLTFDIAAVNSGTFQWQLNIYSGATYSTKTSKYFTSCPTTCTNWNSYATDAVAWQGQSIKVEVQRFLGDLKVDNVAVEQEILVDWSPTAGDKVSRQTGGPTDAYAKTSTTIISQPYTVDSEAQNGSVDLKVEGASGSYSIYVLSGQNYGTSTLVYSGTQADSSTWGTRTFGIGDFAGQSIKFKVVPAANTTVSVDQAAISQNEVPGWAAAGTGVTNALGSDGGVSYLANVLDQRSQPLTLDFLSYSGNTRVNWFRIVYRMYSNYNGQQNDVGSTLNVYFAGSVSPFWGTTGNSWGSPYDPTGVWIEKYFKIYNPNSPFTPVAQTGQLKIKGWPPPGTLNWKSPDVMLIQVVDGPGQNKILGAGECEDMDILPDDMCPKTVTSSTPDPVELTSGNFFHAHTDLAIPGRGIPLRLTRSYSAQGSTNGVGTIGPLGVKWSHNWQASLTEFNSGNNVQVRLAGGSSLTWNKVSGTFQPPTGFEGSLVKNGDSSWTLTTKRQLVYTFDSSGKFTSVEDRNGNATTLAYTDGLLTSITDPGDRSLTLTYDEDDRIATVTDPLDREVSYDYDENGDLVTVTDVKSGTTSYEYSGHLLTQATDSNDHVFVSNTYDAQGRVTEQLTARFDTMTTAYSTPDDGATRVTDALGNQITYYFDTSLRITDVVRDGGETTHFTYDSDNNKTCVTDPLGNKTGFDYNSAGNVIEIIDAANTDANCGLAQSGVSTQLTYTSTNDIETIADQLGRETDYIYDTNGNRTRAVRMDDSSNILLLTCYEYDADGLVTAVVESTNLTVPQDPDDPCTGNKTEFGYDDYGNVTNVVDPRFSGQQTPPTKTFTYDLGGRTLTATNELDHTVTYTYDEKNKLLTATDELGNVTTRTYDQKGNLETIIDASRAVEGTAESGAACGDTGTGDGDDDDSDTVVDDGCPNLMYSYDEADRLIEVVDALGNSTTYGYDAVSNRLSVTNANRQAVSAAESGAACGNSGTGDGDDDDSDSVIDDGCPSARFTYDELNRLESSVDALGRTTTYDYDAASNITGRTDARGLLTVYVPDEFNRVETIEYWDGQTLVDDVDFTYNEVGLRTQMGDATGTTAYDYDDLNRILDVTFPGSNVVSYSYDNVGNRDRITYPDSKYVDYTYDEAHRMETATDWDSNETVYTYNDAGMLTKTELPNGVWTDYGYDDADRLTSAVNKKAGPTTISSFAYTLDATGSRTQMVDLSGTHSYEYDPLYRLTEVTYPGPETDTYTYDQVGNRLTKNTDDYTYDAADQLTDLEGVTFDYDDNGNQTARGNDTFEYDHENRLVELVIDSVTSTSEYNGDGLRMSHIVDTTTTDYFWDIARSLPVVLQDGTNTYVYGLDLIAAVDGSGNATYFTYDGLGSTTDLTNGGATVTDQYSYDVFGAVRSHTGSSPNYWQFTGEQLDSAENLYFLRARHYDPATGRFLGKDPLPIGNRYSYVSNNPANAIDPSGMCLIDMDGPGGCGDRYDEHSYEGGMDSTSTPTPPGLPPSQPVAGPAPCSWGSGVCCIIGGVERDAAQGGCQTQPPIIPPGGCAFLGCWVGFGQVVLDAATSECGQGILAGIGAGTIIVVSGGTALTLVGEGYFVVGAAVASSGEIAYLSLGGPNSSQNATYLVALTGRSADNLWSCFQ